jgi:hypothetical protein
MKLILGAAAALMISLPAAAQQPQQTTPSEASHGEAPVQAGGQGGNGSGGIQATSAGQAAAKSGHGHASVPKGCQSTASKTKNCS